MNEHICMKDKFDHDLLDVPSPSSACRSRRCVMDRTMLAEEYSAIEAGCTLEEPLFVGPHSIHSTRKKYMNSYRCPPHLLPGNKNHSANIAFGAAEGARAGGWVR